MHHHEYKHRRGAVPRVKPERAGVSTAQPDHTGAAAPRAPPVGTDEQPRSRRLIRWPAVREKTGKSRTQAWRDVRAGRFPAPVQTGPNSVAWYEDEIDAYVASLPRARYAPTVEAPINATP